MITDGTHARSVVSACAKSYSQFPEFVTQPDTPAKHDPFLLLDNSRTLHTDTSFGDVEMKTSRGAYGDALEFA